MGLLVRVEAENVRSEFFVLGLAGHVEHDIDEVETGKKSGWEVDVFHH